MLAPVKDAKIHVQVHVSMLVLDVSILAVELVKIVVAALVFTQEDSH